MARAATDHRYRNVALSGGLAERLPLHHPALRLMLGALGGLGLGLYVDVALVSSSRLAPMLSVALLGALAGVIVGRLQRLLLAVVLLDIPFHLETHLDYHAREASFGAIGGFSVSVTTFALVMLYALWLGSRLLDRGEPLRLRPAWPLLVYVGFTALSTLAAYARVLSLFELGLLVQTLLLFVYIVSTMRSRDDLVFVVALLCVGLLFESLIMLVTFVLQHNLQFPGIHTRIDTTAGGQAVSPRYGGTVGSPNGTAGYLSLLLVPALALAQARVRGLYRGVGVLALLLGTAALLLTQSRGGWMAFGVAGAIYVVIAARRGWIPTWLPVVVTLTAGVLVLLLHSLLPARLTGNQESTVAATGRIPLIVLALRVIRDHPLLGAGANNYAAILPRYATPEFGSDWLYTVHNKYLLVWAEDGFVALLGFLAFLLATLRRGLRGARLNDPVLAPLAAALAAGVAGQMVHMAVDIFNDRPLVQELWVVAAVVAVIGALPAAGTEPMPRHVPRPARPRRRRAGRVRLRPIGAPGSRAARLPQRLHLPETVPVMGSPVTSSQVAVAQQWAGLGVAPVASPWLEAWPDSPADDTTGGPRSATRAGTLAGLRRVAGNAAALLASDVVNRATTFILYALVARTLGALAFGQMSLALTLFYTFQVLAAAGLRTLVARAVAGDRGRAGRYLASGSLVAAGAGLLSVGATMLFVARMGYPRSTAVAVDLLSLGLLPYALSAVAEAVFVGQERMRYIAYATVPVNLVKVGLAFAVVSGGCGLPGLMALLDGSLAATLVLEWFFLARVIRPGRLAPEPGEAWRLARETLPFLGIDGILAILGSANILLLSHFSGELAVGYYSAGTQALIPLMLIYQNVVTSLFPSMCRHFDDGPRGLRRVSETLIGLLLMLALPVSVGFTLLAAPLVRSVYGPGLEGAVLALQIMVWSLILTAATHVLGQALIASKRESTNLRIVVVDGVLAVVVGMALVPRYGVEGAAVATVLVKLIDFVLHLLPVIRLFGGLRLVRGAVAPGLAAALMGAVFYRLLPVGLAPAVAAGILTYGLTLGALLLVSSGGPDGLRRWAYGLAAEVS